MTKIISIAVVAGLVATCLLVPFAQANDGDESLEAQLRALRERVEAQSAELERGDATLRALRDGAPTSTQGVEEAVDAYLAARQTDYRARQVLIDSHFAEIGDVEGDALLTLGGLVTVKGKFHEPDSAGVNKFYVADARLDVSGHVAGDWRYVIQTKFERQARLDVAFIQADLGAWLGADYLDMVDLTAGKIVLPLGADDSLPEEALDLYDRPILWKATTMTRGYGVNIGATIADGAVRYDFGIVNQAFATRWNNDNGDEFTYYGGFCVKPFHGGDDDMFETLDIGVAMAGGHNRWGMSPGLRSGAAGRDIYGYDGQFESSGVKYFNEADRVDTRGSEFLLNGHASWSWGALAFKSEIRFLIQDNETDNADSETQSKGAYLRANYMVTGEDWRELPSTGIELVGQIEYGTVDAGGDFDEIDFWSCTLGANYYFTQGVRAGLNWNIVRKNKDAASTQVDRGRFEDQETEHVATAFLQVAF